MKTLVGLVTLPFDLFHERLYAAALFAALCQIFIVTFTLCVVASLIP